MCQGCRQGDTVQSATHWDSDKPNTDIRSSKRTKLCKNSVKATWPTNRGPVDYKGFDLAKNKDGSPYEVDKLQLLVLVVQPPVWSQPCPQQTASISFQDIRQFQKNIPCVIIVHDILSYFMIFHQYVHISPHIIYVPCHAIWSQDSENKVKQVNQVNQAAREDPKWTRSKAESNEPN